MSQAEELEDYGGSLTDPVRAQVEPALSIACRQLADWGYPASSRTEDACPTAPRRHSAAPSTESGRPLLPATRAASATPLLRLRELPRMCIGIPMQIRSQDGLTALCAGRGEERRVSLYVPASNPSAPGSWSMSIPRSASSTRPRFRCLNDALDALEAVDRGDPFEHLFADLIGREPQLPDHLKSNAKEQA